MIMQQQSKIFTATVVAGSGRGKELRVPTINVDISSVPKECAEGIYACFVRIENHVYKAAMHYGPRPVFRDTPSCEVHLIDATIASSPTFVDIESIKRLRDVQTFDSVENLKHQMMRDIAEARAILDTTTATL
ncbi:hypothetical protein A3D88_02840 [Candidatus Peribacteria bacterium RIFCSPHIGHO2_02_FULL_52_16]|nr:MAG: hypothetical protein A2706_00670 [Candidatus Peribacteria bacterium RIFCSPHIGHO2_01_FULL_51_35]OGJ61694.1 MAG: hypothetical protein A3D88_02840 [Candidatus Peribacteria bacterium RIFCSPHIGHO2_02_FULL_52_16]